MKTSICLFSLLITLYNLAKLNLGLTVYMFVLILTVIGILLIFQLKACKKIKYIICDVKPLFNITCDIYIKFILLFGVLYLLFPNVYSNDVYLFFYLSFFFFVIVNIALYVNYFSISNLNFKNNLKLFFTSLNSVVNDNNTLNLIFCITILYLKNYNELFIGLLGAYVFYLLTEISNEYKMKKESIKYSLIHNLLLIFLNFSLLIVIACIENLFNSIVYKTSFIPNEYFIYSMPILVFAILLNIHYDKINEIYYKYIK